MAGHDGPSRPFTVSDYDRYERVARKAYELYQQRGEMPGHDVDDWLQAERAVHEELLHSPVPEVPLMEESDFPNEDDRV